MGAAPHPDADGHRRRDGVPAGQAEIQQDQQRLLRRDEYLERFPFALAHRTRSSSLFDEGDLPLR